MGAGFRNISMDLNLPIPAFFLLLLVFQIFFMPGLIKHGSRLYVPFRTIVVGGSQNNPPYEFLDENNEPAGFNVDLTRAIAADMGIDVEIRLGSPGEMALAFAQGRIDILQGITDTDPLARENLFYSYGFYSQKLFTRRGSGQEVTSLDQLKGATVALSRTTPFLRAMEQSHPDIRFITAASHTEALGLLARGSAGYALIIDLPNPGLKRVLGLLRR